MNAIQRIASGAAAAFAVFALAAPAFAGGMKDTPEPRRCTFSANAALTTDYVFRGMSQTQRRSCHSGWLRRDLRHVLRRCLGFEPGLGRLDSWYGNVAASLEMDWYGGVKFNTGKIAWDLGIIYYTYPNAASTSVRSGGRDPNYVELKVNASGEIWKGGTLGGTVYFSPDYQYETGNVWTFEG